MATHPSEDNISGRRMPLRDYAAITLVVIGVGALVALAYLARGALSLAAFGLFLAMGVEPVIRALIRRGVRRRTACAVVPAVAVAVIVALILLFVIPAVRQLGAFAAEVPERLDVLADRLHLRDSPLTDARRQDELAAALRAAAGIAVSSFAAALGVFGEMVGAVAAGITVLALLVYFSLAMPRILAAAGRLLGTPERALLIEQVVAKVGGYVSGQAVLSACAGAVSFLFFLLIGAPHPAMLALAVAILDAIPQVGALLAAILSTAAVLTEDNIWFAVATVGYFCVYQLIENYLLAPHVFARAIALTPATAFVATLVGVSVAGLLGAIVALPVTAAVKVVVHHWLWGRGVDVVRPETQAE
ncbi:putative PurR-regulated permease PerM [Kibdelosporangium banguiense]|uniref:PurR-regulated permease PerM n=1 Tax=Kibdelosporangium banguiense TaxID=1365924 RepID=A0ABS4THM0_9PSEU|nr:AI-2E family transporter [Kibdelosporangium banguiense]MBP2323499.1 putative PurR-regulated permease PerM [Kibdelosporangium banguiense]